MNPGNAASLSLERAPDHPPLRLRARRLQVSALLLLSIFTRLNHERAPMKLSTHRNFVFTLHGVVYLRYNSFATPHDLKKQVCAYNPTRFEIGLVYFARTVRSVAFAPQLRELIINMGMFDCVTADICCRC
ncbi:hypothetical protein BD310DRAFT_944806 [Dichomitus squalens]|uniref:Uncharacterized protein n=1 Tax=Dichomitus squalens TaxID=114155 RepID=A0A4Q9Q8B7_9APHY|nr:hypothetical protein BD310DRAFT_944806 [Dichomitus squalens]